MLEQSMFSIELWNKADQRSAVISGMVPGCTFTQSRNNADEISWNVPLETLHAYAVRHFTTVAELLVPRNTEVHIKYGGILVAMGELIDAPLNINQDGLMLNLKAEGVLNWFADRYLEEELVFVGEQATTIAATLLIVSQAQGPDWDFDVTIGDLATTGVHDITYKAGTNIKDALQNLTRRENAAFDFEFTPDRVFNAYQMLGSYRPEVKFSYPGNILPGSTIAYFGTELANRILVYGSGISEEAASPRIVNDLASQAQYKVRQAKLALNDVSRTDTLDEHGMAELAARGNPIKLPTLKVDGNASPQLTTYAVGDYVGVKLDLLTYLDINIMLRLERREVDMNEKGEITVTNYVSY